MRNKKLNVPPADIILNILNGADEAAEQILDYYEGYIIVSATFPIYDEAGAYLGLYADHDLMQDMRLNLYNSIPALKRRLHLHLHDPNAVVIILN